MSQSGALRINCEFVAGGVGLPHVDDLSWSNHVGARRYGRHSWATQHIGPYPRAISSARWARTTENPTTKLLAEGLTHLSEAVRELHQELETIENRVKALGD
jgi:hypothetical protein